MSSGFEPEQPDPVGPPIVNGRTTAPLGRDRGLLEHVLAQTDQRNGAAGGVDRDVLIALREVANRHRGLPFCLDPIACELVRAVLKGNFPGPADHPPFVQMFRQIALTLFEDPNTCERLQEFWTRLSQVE